MTRVTTQHDRMVRAMRAVDTLTRLSDSETGYPSSSHFSPGWVNPQNRRRLLLHRPTCRFSCPVRCSPYPSCFAGLISWRGIVMALVVVCISNLQDSDAPSLTNHCRPISLSSCLRRLLGVPPAPPHRLRWPLERPNLLNILLHTHHNLHSLII